MTAQGPIFPPDGKLVEEGYRNIEPVLKYVAVAYGAGFLTVMLHTYTLGVPVVELVEPIYVWVGLPVAVVLYFIGPLIAAFRRTREKLRLDLERVEREYRELRTIKTAEKATEALFNITHTVLSVLQLGPPGLSLAGPIVSALQHIYLKKLQKSGNTDLVSNTQNIASLLFFVVEAVLVFYRFVVRVLILASIPLASVVYALSFYPIVPQGLGGGKPTQVRLVVDAMKIPMDVVELQALFPAASYTPTAGTTDGRPSEKQSTKPAKAEGRTTCEVNLHYQTEHAYYIRRGDGPIIVIDHDAVEGIIYRTRKDTKPPGCT